MEADLLAKSKVTPYDGPPMFNLPGNLWGCYVGKTCIVKQFDTSLCTWINGQETKMYWVNCKKLATNQVNDVD